MAHERDELFAEIKQLETDLDKSRKRISHLNGDKNRILHRTDDFKEIIADYSKTISEYETERARMWKQFIQCQGDDEKPQVLKQQIDEISTPNHLPFIKKKYLSMNYVSTFEVNLSKKHRKRGICWSNLVLSVN